MAAWKSIECIIGAAVILTPGTGSSLRLVMLNLTVSPTRARMVGPGTLSPNVHALNFTPGAISITLCVVSSCTILTGAGSSGFSTAPKLSAAPWANAPVCLPSLTLAGGDLKTMPAGSYRSATAAGACAWAPGAASAAMAVAATSHARRMGFMALPLGCEGCQSATDIPSCLCDAEPWLVYGCAQTSRHAIGDTRCMLRTLLFGAACAGASLAGVAEQKTVCTITVNSADEKEALRARLPRDRYAFVELLQEGRADW